jgi:hypothetical protein
MPDPRDNPSGGPQAGVERRFFGALCALLGLFYAWLQLSRRIPANHDSLDVLLIQHLFLGQSSREDGLLLWLPYSTHGILTSWMVGAGGLFHNAAVLVGAGRDGVNTVPLFNLGMLFEEFLLLVGVWRLSRTYLRTPPARFLVTAWAVGSSFWAQQMWHNHRPVFAIPLILSLFHDFLEDGRRAPLFLAVNLLFLQFLGNLAYVAVMMHAVVAAYLIVYVLTRRRSLRLTWPALRPRLTDAALMLPNLLVLFCIHQTLTGGTSEITMKLFGRNPDGTVSLTGFLTYPGELDPVRYGDLLLGVSPSMDYTLYCGIAAVPFAATALLLRPGRNVLHLTAFLALVFLLSLGYMSAVGMPAYLLPPVRYFRYIALTAVHVRLPLVLLAGVGVEALLGARRLDPVRLRGAARMLGLLGLACALLALKGRAGELNLPGLLGTPNHRLAGEDTLTDAGLAGALVAASVAALGAAAAIFVLSSRPGLRPVLTALVLVLLVGDVVRWRVLLTRDRTAALSPEEYRQLEIRPLPFVRRRSMEAADPARLRLFGQPALTEHAARYDTTENFIARDPVASPFIISHWMSPVDRLLRAYANEPLTGVSRVTPQVWRDGPTRPPFDQIVGQADKLQVFSGFTTVESGEELARQINRAGADPGHLYLEPLRRSDHPAGVSLPEGSHRINAPIEVISFDGNHLRAKVTLPGGLPGGVLLYCDAWHSDWTATVNGAPVDPARAFFAYKAVPLGPGANDVEFRMRSPWRVWTFRVAAANAGAWVIGAALLGAAAFRRRPTASRAASGGA